MTNLKKTALIIMEDIAGVDRCESSSYLLSIEALRRGWQLFHVCPKDLMVEEGKVFANGYEIIFDKSGKSWAKGQDCKLDVATTDVVLMRQDPPFDMAYLSVTYMLDIVADKTLVFNNPVSIRNMGEKFSGLQFAHLAPATIVTARKSDIEEFRDKYENIILKPIYGHGGAGIIHVGPDNFNLSAIFEMYKSMNQLPIVVQRRVPEIECGDKRILMVDGEIAGAFLRVPAEGEARANVHAGGTAKPVELTEADRKICAEVGPVLKQTGLLFVGLDIIGDSLIEINMSSPGGIEDIIRFENRDISADIWQAIENRL